MNKRLFLAALLCVTLLAACNDHQRTDTSKAPETTVQPTILAQSTQPLLTKEEFTRLAVYIEKHGSTFEKNDPVPTDYKYDFTDSNGYRHRFIITKYGEDGIPSVNGVAYKINAFVYPKGKKTNYVFCYDIFNKKNAVTVEAYPNPYSPIRPPTEKTVMEGLRELFARVQHSP